MEIVPTVDALIVEARISPMDIDRVRIGQPAEIRFSVFKDAYLVSGELTNLSPDRLIDAASEMPYYSAEVKILQEDMVLLGGMKLVPGMPAEVLIKTGQRTMLGYITSPLNRTVSLSLTED
jgi:epimerase transport system membrane fusion protein